MFFLLRRKDLIFQNMFPMDFKWSILKRTATSQQLYGQAEMLKNMVSSFKILESTSQSNTQKCIENSPTITKQTAFTNKKCSIDIDENSDKY